MNFENPVASDDFKSFWFHTRLNCCYPNLLPSQCLFQMWKVLSLPLLLTVSLCEFLIDKP